MAINKYDEYQPFDFPFESLLKSGAIKQERVDRSNDALDKFHAVLSSINPAPGHEDYARDVVGKYYKEAEDLVNSGIKPQDPRFMQQTRRMLYKAAADQDIKNIQNSRSYYDNIIAKALPDVKAKAGIAMMPGAMDKNNNFIQNRQRYDNFEYAIGDYNKEMADYIKNIDNEVKSSPETFGAYTYQSKGPDDPMRGLDGKVVVTEGESVREWKDADTVKAGKLAMLEDWRINPNATEGRRRFMAEFGYDPDQIMNTFDYNAEQFYSDRTISKKNHQFISPERDYGNGGTDNSKYNYEVSVPSASNQKTISVKELDKNFNDMSTQAATLAASLDKAEPNSQTARDLQNQLDNVNDNMKNTLNLRRAIAVNMQKSGDYKVDLNTGYREYKNYINSKYGLDTNGDGVIDTGKFKGSTVIRPLMSQAEWSSVVKGESKLPQTQFWDANDPTKKYRQKFGENIEQYATSGAYTKNFNIIVGENDDKGPTAGLEGSIKQAILRGANMQFVNAEESGNMGDIIKNLDYDPDKTTVTTVENPFGGEPSWQVQFRDSKGKVVKAGYTSFENGEGNDQLDKYSTDLFNYYGAEKNPNTRQHNNKLDYAAKIKGGVAFGKDLEAVMIHDTDGSPITPDAPVTLNTGHEIMSASEYGKKYDSTFKESTGYIMLTPNGNPVMQGNEVKLFRDAQDIQTYLGYALLQSGK